MKENISFRLKKYSRRIAVAGVLGLTACGNDGSVDRDITISCNGGGGEYVGLVSPASVEKSYFSFRAGNEVVVWKPAKGSFRNGGAEKKSLSVHADGATYSFRVDPRTRGAEFSAECD